MRYKQVHTLLEQEGELLTETLLECCVTALPSSMMVSKTWLSIIHLFVTQMYIQSLPTYSSCVSNEMTMIMIKQLCHCTLILNAG